MCKVGVFPMKGLPFHRGHLTAILKASTMCDKLYVVVSDNPTETRELCKGIKYISLQERMKWVSQELQDLDYIKVIGIDESGIPVFPNGWLEWSELLKNSVPEEFHVIYGNEESYRENHNKYFPNAEYVTFDVDRKEFTISGTEIRTNPLKHWDYLTGASRSFFSKKVLISGTESTGKSSLTKALAKVFYTSWSEEVGRYYSERYLGGNEEVFKLSDFERICWLQHEQDLIAHKTANKVSIHDTDALITNFYAEQYLGEQSEFINEFSKRQEYDLIIMMKPDVKWVDDGLRWLNEQSIRESNHTLLVNTYKKMKPNTKIIEVGGNYTERLNACISIIKELIEE